MRVATTIADARRAADEARRARRRVGFVPTMGSLHPGHVALIRTARQQCDFVAVSIFVNPTQFCPGEDFERYPRPLEEDLATCRAERVDLVFNPTTEEMYGPHAKTTVAVRDLTERLCGPFRPGHFDGVTTVVTKLFHVISPCAAYFGEKDYQQLQVIKRMVRDLDTPVSVVGCATVREPDGLAVSSRNQYLTPAQRQQATVLNQAMNDAAQAIETGERDAASLCRKIRDRINASGPVRIDYVNIVDPSTLEDVEVVDRPVRICLAVHIGSTRLIDNRAVDVPGPAG